MTAIRIPTKIFAQRVLAPELTTKAVPESDPPEGIPLKKLAARLATPCPKKSPDGSGNFPSGFGYPWEIPAPWTKPMMLMAKAGTIKAKSKEKSGRLKRGKTLGTSVTSPTVGTRSNPGNAARVEAANIANIKEYGFVFLLLLRRRIRITVVNPTANIGGTIWV